MLPHCILKVINIILLDENSHTRDFINELSMNLILSAIHFYHTLIIFFTLLKQTNVLFSHGILTKHQYTHFVLACI